MARVRFTRHARKAGGRRIPSEEAEGLSSGYHEPTRVEAPLLEEALPALAQELKELLRRAGESDLADQVPKLRIIEVCDCGDDFCASFFTGPRPKGAWGPGHETIPLEPEEGDLLVDVVDRKIAYIEVLWRDEIREAVLRLTHKLSS